MAQTGTELTKLIRRGVTLTQKKKTAEEGLSEVKSAIEKYFKKEKTTEQLTSEFGIAERKISRSYSIEPINIQAVREFLQDSYEEYVSETRDYKPTPKLRKLLNEGELPDIEHIIDIKESASVRFIPAEA